MNYRDLRDYADALGRFASVRANAKEPSDRIVVQCFEGLLAFVAGVEYSEDARATLKVDAGEEATSGMAVVAARPFLQAAKSLKGKGEVHIEIDDAGIALRTAIGGEIKFPNIATKIPDLLRVNANQMGWATFEDGFLGRAAKVLSVTTKDAYSGWEQIEFRNDVDSVILRGGTAYMHAEFRVENGLDWPIFVGAFHPGFLDSIKDFDQGYIWWATDQLRIESGPYLAVTNFMERFPELPPFPAKGALDTKVVIERKGLIESLKTIGSEKIEMSPTKSGITLAAWPDRKARLDMAAQVTGHAKMATMTEMLARLATALDGDQLEIEWESDATGPLHLTGSNSWAILGRVPLHM